MIYNKVQWLGHLSDLLTDIYGTDQNVGAMHENIDKKLAIIERRKLWL